jgi:hypothetical protein
VTAYVTCTDVHKMLAKSLLIRMYALIFPKERLGVCDYSRSLAVGVISLSFRTHNDLVDTILCQLSSL